MSKKLKSIYEARSRAKTEVKSFVSDIITNIQTVKYFGNINFDQKLFVKINEFFNKKRFKAWSVSSNYQEAIGFLPGLFIVAVTLYSVGLARQGIVTTGSVIMVYMLSSQFSGSLRNIGFAVKGFVSDISDTAEAIEIIEQKPTVVDLKAPEEVLFEKGNILFDDVTFTYPKGSSVFDEFNFNIQAGKSVGIVGKSGSGKTTITKLLLRLYDIEEGEILIDDQDIVKLRQNDLRQNIAYIPQETILFHRTIYENILYARPSATREEVLEAARLAHVDEFATQLADGYETKVGERGVKLSGGQRQRIGIARAMLKKDAPILVMDEATSALDSESEKLIQDSFEAVSRGRTTIVIAHRLSTIQKLDRIIVMENGNIIQDGSHDTLIEQEGVYKKLWNSQQDGFIA